MKEEYYFILHFSPSIKAASARCSIHMLTQMGPSTPWKNSKCFFLKVGHKIQHNPKWITTKEISIKHVGNSFENLRDASGRKSFRKWAQTCWQWNGYKRVNPGQHNKSCRMMNENKESQFKLESFRKGVKDKGKGGCIQNHSPAKTDHLRAPSLATSTSRPSCSCLIPPN